MVFVMLSEGTETRLSSSLEMPETPRRAGYGRRKKPKRAAPCVFLGTRSSPPS
jgi:hypothetical protein